MEELMRIALMNVMVEDIAKSHNTTTKTVISDFMAFSAAIDELMADGMSEDDAILAVSKAWVLPF